MITVSTLRGEAHRLMMKRVQCCLLWEACKAMAKIASQSPSVKQVRFWFIVGVACAVGGILSLIAAALGSGLGNAVSGAAGLLLSVYCFITAGVQHRRREQHGCGQVLPEPSPDVLTLSGQGRKIRAIKRYRRLNPGVSLKDAKGVIDGL